MLELEGFVDFSALLKPAVYALVRRGEVVYVGQSVEPIARVYTHRSGWHRKVKIIAGRVKKVKGIVFDAIWLMSCSQSQLDSLEVEMIRKYQPRHNIKDKPRPVPLDLAEVMRALAPIMPTASEPRIRRRI